MNVPLVWVKLVQAVNQTRTRNSYSCQCERSLMVLSQRNLAMLLFVLSHYMLSLSHFRRFTLSQIIRARINTAFTSILQTHGVAIPAKILGFSLGVDPWCWGSQRAYTGTLAIWSGRNVVTDRQTDIQLIVEIPIACVASHGNILHKKAQLTLSNPRDAKACKNCCHSTLKRVTV